MPMSPHHAPIPKKGNLVLRDGMLIAERDDGQEFGRLMVGEDGLIYNGGEFGIAQKGDPAAINLISTAVFIITIMGVKIHREDIASGLGVVAGGN